MTTGSAGWYLQDGPLCTKHITPIKDIAAHELKRDCLCAPAIEHHGISLLVTHNAWDRREEQER